MAVANKTAASDDTSPIDWDFAERIAIATSGRTDFARTPASVTMPVELPDLASRACEIVEEFTRLETPFGDVDAVVIDRPTWIRVNTAGFRKILKPVANKIVEAQGPGGARSRTSFLSRRILGAELGLLLGFVSQRVLGQFDLLGGDDTDSAKRADGTVYFVGPNIAALERKHGFNPRDFRLWIAIHEVTHRTQFGGVPWMRGYFMSLVEQGLEGLDFDPQNFVERAATVLQRIRSKENALGEGIMDLIAPGQRAVFETVQALMTLLEGHGNFVMDELGDEYVRGRAEMSRVLQQRRRQGGLQGIVFKLIGMEMKARQYEEGQRFIVNVCNRIGRRGLDPAWEKPSNLPTIAELRGDPAEWIARVYAESPV